MRRPHGRGVKKNWEGIGTSERWETEQIKRTHDVVERT